jgi:hypothetical protein
MRPPTQQHRPQGSTRPQGRSSPMGCTTLPRRMPHKSAPTWPRTRVFGWRTAGAEWSGSAPVGVWMRSGSRGNIPLRSRLDLSLKIRGTERLRSTFSSPSASRLPPVSLPSLPFLSRSVKGSAAAVFVAGGRLGATGRSSHPRPAAGWARPGGALTRGQRSTQPTLGQS